MSSWPLQELARLKLEIREAIKREAYEQAALLRDKIQSLEDELKNQPIVKK
jgi:protein-arginine kinase activator protein McsA